MPFYDLHCTECEKEFNVLASVREKTEKLIACPECGSLNLKTVYKGAPAYIKSTKDAAVPECPNRRICGGGCHYAG
jgi:putative FmdB family regulatory protein